MHFIIRRLNKKKMAQQFTFLILFMQLKFNMKYFAVTNTGVLVATDISGLKRYRTAPRANGQNQITERGLFASHPREWPAETYKPFPRIRIQAILSLAFAPTATLHLSLSHLNVHSLFPFLAFSALAI